MSFYFFYDMPLVLSDVHSGLITTRAAYDNNDARDHLISYSLSNEN